MCMCFVLECQYFIKCLNKFEAYLHLYFGNLRSTPLNLSISGAKNKARDVAHFTPVSVLCLSPFFWFEQAPKHSLKKAYAVQRQTFGSQRTLLLTIMGMYNTVTQCLLHFIFNPLWYCGSTTLNLLSSTAKKKLRYVAHLTLSVLRLSHFSFQKPSSKSWTEKELCNNEVRSTASNIYFLVLTGVDSFHKKPKCLCF